MRVLDRNGLTEVDITNMTEAEAERSTLGRQMMFELAHSDWSEEQSEIENKLRKQEDEADVASRREMVLAENARTEFPYPPKKIRSLLRRRRKDIEAYSGNLYWIEMLGVSSPDRWQPVDASAVIAAMTAEAIHKRAFYMVGESERLTKISLRQRQARFVLDLPKYALIGVALIVGLFVIGLGSDLLEYLHRAPTVVETRIALSRLWNWLFTDAGLMTALVVAVVVIVFMKVRKRLTRFAEDA